MTVCEPDNRNADQEAVTKNSGNHSVTATENLKEGDGGPGKDPEGADGSAVEDHKEGDGGAGEVPKEPDGSAAEDLKEGDGGAGEVPKGPDGSAVEDLKEGDRGAGEDPKEADESAAEGPKEADKGAAVDPTEADEKVTESSKGADGSPAEDSNMAAFPGLNYNIGADAEANKIIDSTNNAIDSVSFVDIVQLEHVKSSTNDPNQSKLILIVDSEGQKVWLWNMDTQRCIVLAQQFGMNSIPAEPGFVTRKCSPGVSEFVYLIYSQREDSSSFYVREINVVAPTDVEDYLYTNSNQTHAFFDKTIRDCNNLKLIALPKDQSLRTLNDYVWLNNEPLRLNKHLLVRSLDEKPVQIFVSNDGDERVLVNEEIQNVNEFSQTQIIAGFNNQIAILHFEASKNNLDEREEKHFEFTVVASGKRWRATDSSIAISRHVSSLEMCLYWCIKLDVECQGVVFDSDLNLCRLHSQQFVYRRGNFPSSICLRKREPR